MQQAKLRVKWSLCSRAKKKVTPTKKKKPDGVSREVFALQESQGIGSSKASVAPTILPVFKEKRKIGTGRLSWSWKPFRNSARKDNAVFYHWIRSDDKSEDYRFARFNKKLNLPSYTDEEYEKHFQDPNWTKAETDQLFDLCRRFDLRFIVIADRFDANKTIEDMKERFYSIAAKLVELHATPDEDILQNPLARYVFNKSQDVARKQQCERFYRRSKEQVAEEEELISQFRRIETQLKKHHSARKRVIHLMQTALATSATQSYAQTQAEIPTENIKTTKRNKKRKHLDDDFNEPDDAEMSMPPPELALPRSRSRGSISGAFVKSAKATTPLSVGSKTAQRVDAALIELGMNLRPNPPTQSVSKMFNDLRQDIVILLDLQKHISQKEYHLEVLKAQRQALFEEFQMQGLVPPSLTTIAPTPNINTYANSNANAISLVTSTRFGLASFDAALDDSKGLDDLTAEWAKNEWDVPATVIPPSRVQRDGGSTKRPTKKQKGFEIGADDK
jgi:DNA methyltransferase 1-associated protein 1